MSIFLKECFLQKTNQFEALRIKKFQPEAIELGAELQLTVEKDDPAAKDKVVAKTMGDTPQIIGILSDVDVKDIRHYLEMNWNHIYLCRVSKADYNADENKRLSIAIFIRNSD